VYLLDVSPEVARIRKLINGRLLDEKGRKVQQRALDRGLITLCRGGYVTLDPKPPHSLMKTETEEDQVAEEDDSQPEDQIDETKSLASQLTFGQAAPPSPIGEPNKKQPAKAKVPPKSPLDDYQAITATPLDLIASC